jgi:hypothetical protein
MRNVFWGMVATGLLMHHFAQASGLTSPAVASGCLAYQGLMKAYGASYYWPLNEASGTTARDVIGTNTGTYVNSPTLKQGGFSNVRNMAASFVTASSQQITTTTSSNTPINISVMIWFKTTTTSGGVLIQFSNSQTGSPGDYDRHIYMQNSGIINWGVYPGSTKVVSSTSALNDGNWHMAIGTIGSSGQTLYIDGNAPITVATVTTAQSYSGWWRVAYGAISGWPNMPTNLYFTGTLSSPAIFSSQLTTAQAAKLYAVGKTCGP